MRSVMDFITRRYPGVRETKTPGELVEWLRAFHTELAEQLHAGKPILDLVPDRWRVADVLGRDVPRICF